MFKPNTLLGRIALRVATFCAVRDNHGVGKVFYSSGCTYSIVLAHDGGDLTVACGKRVQQFPVTSHMIVLMARWIVWWYVVHSWCGLRQRIYTACLSRLYDDQDRA